jgi:hypothetical protein
MRAIRLKSFRRVTAIKILSQRKANQVLVAVQDSGVGTVPEDVDRLFNAFFTTKPSGWAWLSRSAGRSSNLTAEVWAACNATGAGATVLTLQVRHQAHEASS